MEKDIQILVVDDHQVVREGLRRLLEQEEDIELVGQGANSEETLIQVEMLSPNIVLMDIKMPGMNGIELTRQVKQKYPSCKVIMLTLYDEYLNQAIEAGASGYLLKDIKREELAQAIRRVHHGEVVISESITAKTPIGHEDSYSQNRADGAGAMVDEAQLVIAPPVDANQLMRFTGRAEDLLWSRVLQVVGSWREGTVVTILLNKSMPLVDILNKLREMPEIKAVGENPLNGDDTPDLLKKAEAVPRLKNRMRKTLFLSFEKD
jgi:DNA-binding NarL/FixJ family response regulator